MSLGRYAGLGNAVDAFWKGRGLLAAKSGNRGLGSVLAPAMSQIVCNTPMPKWALMEDGLHFQAWLGTLSIESKGGSGELAECRVSSCGDVGRGSSHRGQRLDSHGSMGYVVPVLADGTSPGSAACMRDETGDDAMDAVEYSVVRTGRLRRRRQESRLLEP